MHAWDLNRWEFAPAIVLLGMGFGKLVGRIACRHLESVTCLGMKYDWTVTVNYD